MTDPNEAREGPRPPEGDDKLGRKLARLEARRARARREGKGTFWSQLAKVGTLGWLVALPIVGGALLGHLIDRHFGTGVTFALALMMVGIAVGGYFLWRTWQDVGGK